MLSGLVQAKTAPPVYIAVVHCVYAENLHALHRVCNLSLVGFYSDRRLCSVPDRAAQVLMIGRVVVVFPTVRFCGITLCVSMPQTLICGHVVYHE